MDILFRCKLVVDVSTALDLMGFMGEMFWFKAVVPRTGSPDRLRLKLELRGCWFIFPQGMTEVDDGTCGIPLLEHLFPMFPMVSSVLDPTVTVTSPLSEAPIPAAPIPAAPIPVVPIPVVPIPAAPGLAALMLLALI